MYICFIIRYVTKAEMSQQEKNRDIKKIIICDIVRKQNINSKQNIKGALEVKGKSTCEKQFHTQLNPKTSK